MPSASAPLVSAALETTAERVSAPASVAVAKLAPVGEADVSAIARALASRPRPSRRKAALPAPSSATVANVPKPRKLAKAKV